MGGRVEESAGDMGAGDAVTLVVMVAAVFVLVGFLAFSYREEDDDWFR